MATCRAWWARPASTLGSAPTSSWTARARSSVATAAPNAARTTACAPGRQSAAPTRTTFHTSGLRSSLLAWTLVRVRGHCVRRGEGDIVPCRYNDASAVVELRGERDFAMQEAQLSTTSMARYTCCTISWIRSGRAAMVATWAGGTARAISRLTCTMHDNHYHYQVFINIKYDLPITIT